MGVILARWREYMVHAHLPQNKGNGLKRESAATKDDRTHHKIDIEPKQDEGWAFD